jgi:hypothetical protein
MILWKKILIGLTGVYLLVLTASGIHSCVSHDKQVYASSQGVAVASPLGVPSTAFIQDRGPSFMDYILLDSLLNRGGRDRDYDRSPRSTTIINKKTIVNSPPSKSFRAKKVATPSKESPKATPPVKEAAKPPKKVMQTHSESSKKPIRISKSGSSGRYRASRSRSYSRPRSRR